MEKTLIITPNPASTTSFPFFLIVQLQVRGMKIGSDTTGSSPPVHHAKNLGQNTETEKSQINWARPSCFLDAGRSPWSFAAGRFMTQCVRSLTKPRYPMNQSH